jgi:two-component system repressor protein LuxO
MEAESAIARDVWPGNVRQLQNVIRNVVVLHDGPLVTRAMLPARLFQASPREAAPEVAPVATPGAVEPLAVVEKKAILAALEHTSQDVPRAAALLDVNPSTIYRKLAAWKKAG